MNPVNEEFRSKNERPCCCQRIDDVRKQIRKQNGHVAPLIPSDGLMMWQEEEALLIPSAGLMMWREQEMNGRVALLLDTHTQGRIDDVRKKNRRVALLIPSNGLMMWREDHESEK